jgi:NhaP-type Na+/H+ or K+/H+ antiporter
LSKSASRIRQSSIDNLEGVKDMGVLEVAIASLIWARRNEQAREEFYDTDIHSFFARLAFAFAAFAAVITGLQVAVSRHADPQMVADREISEMAK